MKLLFKGKVNIIQNIRRRLAYWLALFAREALLLLGRRASSFPGRVALKVYPQILADLVQGRDVLVVSGTNGKTSTTSMLAAIVAASNRPVVYNASGANMPDGIVSSLLEQRHCLYEENPLLIFEVDEAWYARIGKDLQANCLVLTNLFKDQVERYGDEIGTRDKIIKGIQAAKATACILCADDPFSASIAQKLTKNTPCFYYGMAESDLLSEEGQQTYTCPVCSQALTYEGFSYAQLGLYSCTGCSFRRPGNDLAFTPKLEGASFSYEDAKGTSLTTKIVLDNKAQYNLYNTAAAFLAGLYLKIEPPLIKKALEGHKSLIGRRHSFNLEGRQVCVQLAKNAVGFTVALQAVEKAGDADHIFFIVNNNENDGFDTSWFFDIDYSYLLNISSRLREITVSGMKAAEFAGILREKGVEQEKIIVEENIRLAFAKMFEKVKSGEKIYILPNYTAMLELYAILENNK